MKILANVLQKKTTRKPKGTARRTPPKLQRWEDVLRNQRRLRQILRTQKPGSPGIRSLPIPTLNKQVANLQKELSELRKRVDAMEKGKDTARK